MTEEDGKPMDTAGLSAKAYVQAGGGVVADSNGPYEYTESANKARAGSRAGRDFQK